MSGVKAFTPDSRIVTLVGHYGSGKSELAINIALLFADEKKIGEGLFESAPFSLSGLNSREQASLNSRDRTSIEPVDASDVNVCLADLDVVNPYFRSREASDYLKSKGVKVIASAEAFPNVDLPFMPEEMASLFQNENTLAVIDAGGDPAGARVLARYSNDLKKNNAEVYFVLNANRPFTKTVSETIKCIRDIEGAANIRITGILNNTHLMGKTEIEDIQAGALLAEEVSRETGIPVVAHAVSRDLLDSALEEFLIDAESIFLPIDIHLKKPWE